MIDSIAKLVTAASATQLALAAFLSIAAAGIAYTFFKSAPVWARLIAFMSILVFAFLLSIRLIAPASAGITTTNLIKLLATFPQPDRMEKCSLVQSDASICASIVEALAGLTATTASPQLQQEVTQALEQGHASVALIKQAVKAVPQSGGVVTLGNSKGWDIDVFWCRGDNQDAARSSAERTGSLLAAAVSGPIAPGVSIGRVRVRALDIGKPGYPRPGDGAFISVDRMAGKADAVAAIRAKLATEAGLSYTDRPTQSGLPTYLSLFECRGTLPVAIRAGQQIKN